MSGITIGHRHVVALLTIAAGRHDDRRRDVTAAVEYVAELPPTEAKQALLAALLHLDLALARANVDLDEFIEHARAVILRHEAHGE